MPKLLHIEASPRNSRSRSTRIANEFLSAYQTKNAEDEVEKLDIWNAALPAFDGEMLEAKYAVIHQEQHTQEQATAWEKVRSLFDQFDSADRYLFTVPMWNFGIPYRLKQYVDIITQPGMAWSYSPEESYKGLLQNKKAVVVYTSGDRYGQGTGFESFDLQKPYFKLWLNFIGITDIIELKYEGTLFPESSNAEEDVIRHAMKVAVEI